MVFLICQSCKPKVQVTVMGHLNPGNFSKDGCFGQDQILRIIQHRPNMLMDVLNNTKHQGTVGMDQMSLWIF